MTPEVNQRLDAIEDWRLVLEGDTGTNGKLGTQRQRVDLLYRLVAAVGSAAVGAIAVAALALYQTGERHGREQAEAEWLRSQVERNRLDIESLRVETWRLRLGLPPAPPDAGVP